MLYKVSELAEELDIPKRTLRDWLNVGAPHSRDNRNHIWINGHDFATWISLRSKPKRKKKLNDNEAFCLRCKKPVSLIDPEIIPKIGKLIHIRGECPDCGAIINRGGRIGKAHS